MMNSWSEWLGPVVSNRRLDPEFYDPRVEAVTEALRSLNATPLASWVKSAWRGTSPDYDPTGTVRVIKTANVRRFELSRNPESFVSEKFAADNGRALISYGSLLITSTGVGSAGRCFAKLDHDPVVADGHVTIVPTRSIADTGFLCAYLQSPIGKQQILRQHRGSSRQIEIYPEDILKVLVPSLGESFRASVSSRWLSAAQMVQDSINAVNDAEARIEKLVNVDDSMLESLPSDLTWGSTLNELNAARRIDPEYNVPAVGRLRQVLVKSGAMSLAAVTKTIRKGFQPEYYLDDGPIRVVKSKDVRYPELDLESCDRTGSGDWPFYLKGNELLINSTGEGTLGRTGVVPRLQDEDLPLIPAVDVLVLELDSNAVIPGYVSLYLNSRIGRRLTSALQTGSSGQQHLYPSHFQFIPIPISYKTNGSPDLDWQMETVAIAEERVRAMDNAYKVSSELDGEFLKILGVDVDMSTIPY